MNIVILYCGSVHAKSLVDRCIYSGHHPILVDSKTPANDITNKYEAHGVIISGSERSVLNDDAPTIDQEVYNLPIPILGICYGMQRMAVDLGGKVHRFPSSEKGVCKMELNLNHDSALHHGFTVKGVDVFMAHNCQVTQEPEGFNIIGSTSETALAAMELNNLYAVQYHPEKVGHGSGKQVMGNFFRICKEHQDVVAAL